MSARGCLRRQAPAASANDRRPQAFCLGKSGRRRQEVPDLAAGRAKRRLRVDALEQAGGRNVTVEAPKVSCGAEKTRRSLTRMRCITKTPAG